MDFSKAILVGVELPTTIDFSYTIEETVNLCYACDLDVIDVITQSLDRLNVHSIVGKGKIEEIKQSVDSLNVDVVVFNDELSPRQLLNIEEALQVKVIDRTMVILDIFAKRAKTKEAIIQVEIAQLKYMLPRLRGLSNSLSRQKGGIGQRGPGEKKYELDKRKIQNEITHLKKELETVIKVRNNQRRNRERHNVNTVSIVGYTNSGKSTLLNSVLSLTHKDKVVFEKDMLFATLETHSRIIELETHRNFILTDTVGFVSRLPHHLVESFVSTLEEITISSLLLHVVDISNPKFEEQIRVTNDVVKSIGASEVQVLYVFNKIDKCKESVNELINNFQPNICVSAKNKINIDDLLQKIESAIYSFKLCKLHVPFDKGGIFSHLNDVTIVSNVEYDESGTTFEAELDNENYGKYKEYIIEEKEKSK